MLGQKNALILLRKITRKFGRDGSRGPRPLGCDEA